MRQQAMIREADSHVLGEHPGHGKDRQGGPPELEQRRYRSQVEDADDQGEFPMEFAPIRLQGSL
jgi:hypothetical protein